LYTVIGILRHQAVATQKIPKTCSTLQSIRR
jgi:hypothetical protein